jgi:hypothetical protein
VAESAHGFEAAVEVLEMSTEGRTQVPGWFVQGAGDVFQSQTEPTKKDDSVQTLYVGV